jgi:hypothetical protein
MSVLAAGLLAWAGVVIVFAVLGRDRIVPQFFDDLGLEHFVAFYALAFLAAASVPALRLRWLLLGLVVLAGGVEAARGFLGHPWTTVLLDFACNAAGAIAALAPVYLAGHRDAFLSHPEPEPGSASKPLHPVRAR